MALTGGDLADFNNILLESVDETITALLGTGVLSALHSHLLKFHGTRQDEIPYRLEAFSQALQDTFGLGLRTIEKAISKRLYQKLGLRFIEFPNYRLEDYVADAKRQLEKLQSSA